MIPHLVLRQSSRSPSLPRGRRGFTLAEFLMVVAITGVLVVGLAAVVEAPATMLSQEAGPQVAVSDLDRALAELDQDVRYALDVRAPAPGRLEVDVKSGGTVTWSWGGAPGDPLVRTDAGGAAHVVKTVRALAFTIGTTPIRRVSATNLETEVVTGSAARWNGFQLAAGYVFGVVRGLISVIDTASTRNVSQTNTASIYFPAGAAANEGHPSGVSLVLRRNGGSALLAVLYEADPDTKLPIRTSPCAMALVQARALPATLAESTIRLTPLKRMVGARAYVLELRGADGAAADLEVRTLSIAAAALDWGGGLLWSTNGGRNYGPIASLLAASQARFNLICEREQTRDPGDTIGTLAVEVPTSVGVSLTVGEGDGQTVRSSFPVENNLALANQ